MKNEVNIRAFAEADETKVIALWRKCGLTVLHNDPSKDIARKLQVNPEWFLVAELGGSIAGTCMAGDEGHRGWINYLAADPEVQGQGIGTALMERGETLLREAGCPKINLQVRATNTGVVEFYENLGFSDDRVMSLGKRLEVDS